MDRTEIESRIRGDWSLLISESHDLYAMQDHFSFSAQFLKEELKTVEGAVHLGVVEYKQGVMNAGFEFIDSMKYDAKGFDSMPVQANRMRYAGYLAMIQLFLCRGTIRTSRPRTESDRKSDNGQGMKQDSLDLKSIIADVSRRLKETPALNGNTQVKHILMQVTIYKKELAETRRLAASMPREKAAGLAANFSKRVEEITARVRENYLKLLEELNPPPEKPVTGLPSYDLSKLIPLYEKQAKAFMGLYSRLNFVEEQHYGAREILLPLLNQKEQYRTLITEELRGFAQIEPFKDGETKAAMAFTSRIRDILKREAEEAFR